MPDHEVARHRVVEERLDRHVLAEARSLHAAVRRLGCDRQVVVHPRDADVERLAHAEGAGDIRGPDRRRQAVGAVVRERDALGLAVERQNHEHRAEHLALHDLRRLGRTHEQGRRVVRARSIDRVSAHERLSALGDGTGHEPLDTRAVRLRDERPDVGLGVHRIAGHHPGERIAQRGDAVVVHRALEVDARRGGAVLSRVVRRAQGDRVGHRAEVGVAEHDHRRLAPELEVHALHALHGPAHHGLARLRRARDADHVDLAVGDERLADLGVAGHHVEQPGGKPRLDGQLGKPQRRARRGGCRLQDDGIARGERGARLPDRHDEREIPRSDPGDHANRAARQDRRVAVRERAGARAVERARRAGEEPQVVDRERQLPVERRGPRLARVLDLELRELLAVSLQRIREAEQRERSLARGLRGPRRLRGTRRGRSLVDVGQAR